MSMPREIRVTDMNGAPVLRYLCLPDRRYFGGNVHASLQLDRGPHVYHSPESLMGLLGILAHADVALPYDVSGDNCNVILKPEGVRADHLAAILGVPIADVIGHYGLLLKIEDPGGQA